MSSLRVSRIGKSVSVPMAMITPEGTNDGFNKRLMIKNFVDQILTHGKCFSIVVR